MEFSEAGHEIKYFRFRRVAASVIIFGCLDDDIDNVREATAATAALGHGVIDLRRYDKLPAILIEKIGEAKYGQLNADSANEAE